MTAEGSPVFAARRVAGSSGGAVPHNREHPSRPLPRQCPEARPGTLPVRAASPQLARTTRPANRPARAAARQPARTTRPTLTTTEGSGIR